MLKLYYLPGACSTVPHVALQWSGLDYTAEAVGRDTIKSAEYTEKNPQGQVPLLIEGDWALSQNVAILDYVDALAPDAQIFGSKDDLHARAVAVQWLAFANSDLHPAFGLVFGAAAYSDDKAVQELIKAKAVEKIVRLFGSVDARLKDTDWLGGAEISVADVYVYVTLRWVKGLGIDLSRHAHLPAFVARVEANRGVQEVLKAQGLS